MTRHNAARIQRKVAQAKEAHVKARNFAEIGHKHLAFAWRQHRKACMEEARAVKRCA